MILRKIRVSHHDLLSLPPQNWGKGCGKDTQKFSYMTKNENWELGLEEYMVWGKSQPISLASLRVLRVPREPMLELGAGIEH